MTRKMKDSGVEWIGMIPDGWCVSKIKYVIKSPLQYGASESGVEFQESLPRYIRITDISSENKLRDDEKRSLEKDVAQAYILNDEDILFARSGATVGKTFFYRDVFGEAAFAGYLIRASFNKKLVSPKYILYNTLGANYDSWKSNAFTQATIQNIGADKYSNYVFPLPSLPEQQQIADFLDAKCASIDDVIAKTNESIEEYKKLKQAVITEAVTKGVRGKRPMKASDIDWIDEIPKDWNTDKLKRILTERMENNDPVQTSERLSLSIDTGVTLYAEKTTNLDRFKEDVSQYKLAHEGDLVMNSMNVIVGAVGISNYFGCISPAYYTYYDNEPDHVTARYMDYVFRTKSLRALLYRLGKGIYAIDRGDGKVNTCRLKVSREDMRSLKLPLPSVEEQREIVQYLDKKRVDIDTLIAKKQQFIDELTAYKKSLIYEYVTGKKEVPA